MGLAIDTVGFSAVNPGAAGAAVTLAAGDSLRIRNASQSADVRLLWVARQGAAAGFVQLLSPMLHDDNIGIKLFSPADVGTPLLPQDVGQPLIPSDTLVVNLSGGAAETDAGAMGVYYSDLPGSSADLRRWDDIKGAIVHIKPIEVATTTAAAGTWKDTNLNTTDATLKSGTYYGVLGYLTDTVVTAVGLKGAATGNYRHCGPGSIDVTSTSDWFVSLNKRSGLPAIPVINGTDAPAIQVSVLGTQAAAVAVNVTMILAQLSGSF
jgi:hypothetical protein